MINLEEKYLSFLNKVISGYLTSYTLYLFGSRVNGNSKKYSDIDIAISSKELSRSVKAKLEYEFENSTLPYEVDIVDLNDIAEEFRKLIENSLVKIGEK